MNMALNDNISAPLPEAPAASVETWSGKDKGDENFPVGSWAIAKHLRPHVHGFYAFARNADDIADDESLSGAEKRRRLDVMEAVLRGDGDASLDAAAPSAARLRGLLAQSGVPAIHARELLVAFRQDAVQNRYESWAALMDYCRYSAAPVGRFVLDLHGESRQSWPASDALCAALQVVNHIQDAAGDLRLLDRCYVPQDWLAEQGAATDDLARGKTSPALRAVFDRMLAATTDLNMAAAALPALVQARRLRLETAIIAGLARRLTRRLKRNDPLAGRVKLRGPDVVAVCLLAAPRVL